MEPFYLELIKQSPYLAAILLIISWFLKHIKESSAVLQTLFTRFEECAKKNTETIEKVHETMGSITEVIRKCEGKK